MARNHFCSWLLALAAILFLSTGGSCANRETGERERGTWQSSRSGEDKANAEEDEMEGRIVGGYEAEEGSHPSMCAVYRKKDGGPHFQFCAATLMAEDTVVTACHCITKVKPSDVLVGCCIHDLSRPEGSVQREVARFIWHPSYRADSKGYDICMLKLKRRMPLSTCIQPAPLPPYDFYPSGECLVMGWGKVKSDGPTSSKLLQTSVAVLDVEECKNIYKDKIDPTNICAGDLDGGKDSCQGDSGGPLYCRFCEGCPYFLAGVVSWGVGCGEPGYPGVYTCVSSYLDFIFRNVDRNKVLQIEESRALGGGSEDDPEPDYIN